MPFSRFGRAQALGRALAPLTDYYQHSRWATRAGAPGICDFTFGNPHELPPSGFTQALMRAMPPWNPDSYAYKASEPEAQAAAAAGASERLGLPFEPEDIALTPGAFGAIGLALRMLTVPGDEVIHVRPGWFCYEAMVLDAGAVPVAVQADPSTFDLDLDAIASAITERTRVVIVNSPNNPTGRIYSPELLQRLAELLEAASEVIGHPIYVLSDEPYHRLVYAGQEFHSPAEFYPRTVISYSYGKVLLTPGQRLGWLAVNPASPEREELRELAFATQVAMGWAFPNALMQRALGDLERISIDMLALQQRRDLMVDALVEAGYAVLEPEGTFYLWVRSPLADDRRFVDLLADRDVFVLPGSTCGAPGWIRICLTATREMMDRAIPHFVDVHDQLVGRAA